MGTVGYSHVLGLPSWIPCPVPLPLNPPPTPSCFFCVVQLLVVSSQQMGWTVCTPPIHCSFFQAAFLGLGVWPSGLCLPGMHQVPCVVCSREGEKKEDGWEGGIREWEEREKKEGGEEKAGGRGSVSGASLSPPSCSAF